MFTYGLVGNIIYYGGISMIIGYTSNLIILRKKTKKLINKICIFLDKKIIIFFFYYKLISV
jgi:hypothetical protein